MLYGFRNRMLDIGISNVMRIGIITEDSKANYGGLLQAAALQKVLRDMGHDPHSVRKEAEEFSTRKFASFKQFLLYLMDLSGLYTIRKHLQDTVKHPSRLLGNSFCKCFELHLFRCRHIRQTPWIRNGISISDVRKLDFDAYIVGSDQIWRYYYHPNDILQSYLSFLPREIRQRSFSYAASLGVSSWEYPPDVTEACKKLLADFSAVSVREYSGVSLIREHLGREAEWMPDPTCLLTREEYGELAAPTTEPSENYVACYCLDYTEAIARKVQVLAECLGVSVKYLGWQSDGRLQSVESWLRDIRDARCVVTDSFHGCMFSLIFGKEFVCLGNAERGNARFDTLEEMFDMKNVFHPAPDSVLPVRISEERRKMINERLAAYRERGLDFLKRNLEEAAGRKESSHE